MRAASVAESGPIDYVCLSCDAQWTYQEVCHVGCCPACGTGLIRRTADQRPPEPRPAKPPVILNDGGKALDPKTLVMRKRSGS